jgi:cold shock CspA family protein
MSGNDNSACDSVAVIGSHLGRVKWFNSRLGYGFITVTLGDEEMDIFIHQSNVRPNVSKYRTLREGEYVSLNVSESQDTRQAIDVTGVNGGPLNCDLERNQRPRRGPSQNDYDETTNDGEGFTEVPRGRGRRPRQDPQ